MFQKILFGYFVFCWYPFLLKSDTIDCIEGETWYEECKACVCLKHGRYSCTRNEFACNVGTCTENIVFFDYNRRCHCSNKRTICVTMEYQEDINGTSCERGTYLYDNCMLCKCHEESAKYICSPIPDCSLTKGGICREDETVIENCYQCSCTISKFRICRLVENCILNKEKPGKCPRYPMYYPLFIQQYCISERKQECYTDYGCPGVKKCCHLVDCFLRCTNPVP